MADANCITRKARIDLTGQTFNFLTAIEVEQGDYTGPLRWKCVCECGNVVFATPKNLKQGLVKSCGCKNPHALIDRTGARYGRLLVISRAEVAHGKGPVKWLCRCDCGNMVEVRSTNLSSGNSTSCGCATLEASARRLRTHGMSGTPEYSSWAQIKSRCYVETSRIYKYYGGRGIVMCKAWRDSFEAFFADMGFRPEDKTGVDRIDNDGHYSCGHCEECLANNWPANCKWADDMEQGRNRRTNVFITYKGRTQIVLDWCKELGLDRGVLRRRLKTMSVEEAIEGYKRKPRRHHTLPP